MDSLNDCLVIENLAQVQQSGGLRSFHHIQLSKSWLQPAGSIVVSSEFWVLSSEVSASIKKTDYQLHKSMRDLNLKIIFIFSWYWFTNDPLPWCLTHWSGNVGDFLSCRPQLKPNFWPTSSQLKFIKSLNQEWLFSIFIMTLTQRCSTIQMILTSTTIGWLSVHMTEFWALIGYCQLIYALIAQCKWCSRSLHHNKKD